jgi:hypothetical protein
VAGFFKQAKNNTTMNNQNLISSVKYMFQRTRDVPKVDEWPLSYNDDGHEIRTNPATGAQLHFDEHSEIYMMQMVRASEGEDKDCSLDGIVSMSVGNRGSRFAGGTNRVPGGMIAVEGCREDMDTLTVSECYPVFAEVEGSTTVFRIYTFGYMMKLCEEIGLRQEHRPSFNFMFDYLADIFTLPGAGTLPGAPAAGTLPGAHIRNTSVIYQSGPLDYLSEFLPTVGAGLGDGTVGSGIGDGTAGAAERG